MGGIITTLNSYEFLNTVVIVFVCDNTPNRFRFYGPMTMNVFPLSNVKGTSIWCYKDKPIKCNSEFNLKDVRIPVKEQVLSISFTMTIILQ